MCISAAFCSSGTFWKFDFVEIGGNSMGMLVGVVRGIEGGPSDCEAAFGCMWKSKLRKLRVYGRVRSEN